MTLTRTLSALLLLVACSDDTAYTFDPIPPSGPHEVGVVDLTRVDDDRVEPLGPEGPRRYTAAVWYPADPTGSESLRPWLGRFDLEELSDLPKRDRRLVEAAHPVDTWAWQDAPAAAGDERWPVLVFSPGLGALPENYGVTAQDLASHGFVVVTLNHPYDAALTDFGDGTWAQGSTSTLKLVSQQILGAMGLPDMEPGPKKDAKTRKVLSHNRHLQDLTRIRAADMRDAVDLIEEADAGGIEALAHHASRLDTERVGAFGHSIGGAAAVQAALDDPRLAATSNWDGMQWGDVYGQDVGVPLLFLETGSMPGGNDMIYAEVVELEHVYRDDWAHGALTDLPFVGGMDAKDYEKQFGTGDPEDYIPELNGLMRSFFGAM